MGWGRGRFPVLSQLNVITNPGHIDDTYDFFVNAYGTTGAKYTVGDLAHDWRTGSTPPPPWEADEDNLWQQGDAQNWQRHCQKDLNIANAGQNQGTPSTNTVEQDLTKWICEAILAKEHILYRYRRDSTLKPSWKADRIKKEGRWHITVTGPGF